MTKKMLIDASHPEETRVVVADGTRVEDFDFESVNKRQISGNIYLAKITRVEPSLQAAFVDYGGNRHGFLAFNEIHPDYYQIPKADREALLAAEAEAHARFDDDDEPAPARPPARKEPRADKAQGRDKPRRERGKGRRQRDTGGRGAPNMLEIVEGALTLETGDIAHLVRDMPLADDERIETQFTLDSGDAVAVIGPRKPAKTRESGRAPKAARSEAIAIDTVEGEITLEDGTVARLLREDSASEGNSRGRRGRRPRRGRSRNADAEVMDKIVSEPLDDDDGVEAAGGNDAHDEVQESAPPRRLRARHYKIQEVVRRRQIMLVQVSKEERGNKGAALTTYISLAGRYCVLMPNTNRGGGISRKITNADDRKRLKEIARELEVPKGMGLIIRTAGANRTRAEIKRDYEYLLRQWEQIRDLTLQSVAPTLVYEEGNLIKRSIRDLYSKEIDTIHVEGEESYREAKDFMKMLMPSHAKNVQLYKDRTPLFVKHQIENQLSAMFNPTVQLKSGGYIVIGITEALVAVDVNSGRSTRENSIEDTALKTNLEAADEVARQLKLRDLAGLIVIDFIDMDEGRNNRAVEKRMKDALKNDRARIQLGRISSFGLMEMSRQRLRPGMLEASTAPCAHCHGSGIIRSEESLALSILRSVEEEAAKAKRGAIAVIAPAMVSNYISNNKRAWIVDIEQRYGLRLLIEADPAMVNPDYKVERRRAEFDDEAEGPAVTIQSGFSEAPARPAREPDPEPEPPAAEAEPVAEAPKPVADDNTDDDANKARRRGKRGGRKRRRDGDDDPLKVIDLGKDEEAAETARDSGPMGFGSAAAPRKGRRRERREPTRAQADAMLRRPDMLDKAIGEVFAAAEASAPSTPEPVDPVVTAPTEDAVVASVESPPPAADPVVAAPEADTNSDTAAEAPLAASAPEPEVVSAVEIEVTAAPQPAAEKPAEAEPEPAAPAPKPKRARRAGWWSR